MKICVIHPKLSKESANELAEALKADVSNPFAEDRRNYLQYDLVFNYGCNRSIKARKVINPSGVVAKCIDKAKTLEALAASGVNCIKYTTRKEDVPKDWDIVVCRTSVKGARGEGLDYAYQVNGDAIPDAQFYSQYFEHVAEYRVIVFKGKVVARYRKDEHGFDWHLTLMRKKGFEQMDDHCIRGAFALEAEYVGFDVLCNEQDEFVIIEANSAPIITDETIKAIKKELLNP